MKTQPDAEFLKKLTATFVVEAREHVQSLGSCLVELEKGSSVEARLPLVETLFREAHSLKGAARAVNAGEIERLCHALEAAFGDLKSGTRALSVPELDGLHKTVATLGQLIDGLESRDPGSAEAAASTETVVAPAAAAADSSAPAFLPMHGSAVDTVRIASSKLDAIFIQAEELIGVKQAQAERAIGLRELAGLVAERDRLWAETMPLLRTLRTQPGAAVDASARGAGVGSGSQQLPVSLVTLLDKERKLAEAVSARVTELTRATARDRRQFETLAGRLLEDAKKALMLPFSTVLAGFPKMARDLANDAGKDVTFVVQGAEIDIDKRILEKIKDPLVHLVRNSVDHGIEPLAERTRMGKPARGSVTLSIAQAGGKVEIRVTDDGAGFNIAAIRAAAVDAGVSTPGAAGALDDQDAVQLAFRPGVTTNREVTTVSGRGVGMAIVSENVVKLGGTVSIESTPGAGATVRIVLPVSLATLRGSLVRVDNHEFIIPTANVARAMRVSRSSVSMVENRESICVDGSTLALVRLTDVLGLSSRQPAGGSMAPLNVLVLEHGQVRIGFTVDQVIGEQEVLAKPLGPLLRRVRNLAGATVVGTGRVVPILSVPDLLHAAVGFARATGPQPWTGAPAEPVRVKKLLVIDDSITARTLLQNILESAGYDVKTAPDGAVGHAALLAEPFDLVVSDVEMPTMDGFELTKRIRGEPKLAELPVVLVTAREGKEDRERGIEAGANAYIVKSSFDQLSLIEIIGKLI
jgi:two-component system chemotaxis sensor kinase CheA